MLGPVLFVLYTTPLSDIIANHSVNHQLFADDTQRQKSSPPNDVQSVTHDLQSCIDDIKAWMCNNQLNLNPLGPRPATALSLRNPMRREVTVSNDPGIQL